MKLMIKGSHKFLRVAKNIIIKLHKRIWKDNKFRSSYNILYTLYYQNDINFEIYALKLKLKVKFLCKQ